MRNARRRISTIDHEGALGGPFGEHRRQTLTVKPIIVMIFVVVMNSMKVVERNSCVEGVAPVVSRAIGVQLDGNAGKWF